jgi:hypothetical protein
MVQLGYNLSLRGLRKLWLVQAHMDAVTERHRKLKL